MADRISVPGFVGPSNTQISRNAVYQRTVNYFIEGTAPGKGKVPRYLLQTPGLRVFGMLPDQPVRGIFHQDGRMFGVGGGQFCEVFENGAYDHAFPIANDLQPVSFASNGSAGHQLLVGSGGVGYIYDLIAHTFTQITATGFPVPVQQVAFTDGFFLALQGGGSRRFQISAPEDGLLWDPLDGAERSQASDNLVTMIRVGKEVWFLGTQTSEVWGDVGDPLFPFAPVNGVLLEQGSQATFGAQRCGGTIVWLGLNENGKCVVYRGNGYTADRISTNAVEFAIQQAETPTDTRSWVYQENGHVFFVLVIPRDIETSWVCDVSEPDAPWCERGTWDLTIAKYVPHVAGCHCFAFDRHLVGDRFSGAIYHMSEQYFDERIVPAT